MARFVSRLLWGRGDKGRQAASLASIESHVSASVLGYRLLWLCSQVTDAKDRRLLMTMLEGFYSVKVMEMENAPLSTSGHYIVPSDGTHKVAELAFSSEPSPAAVLNSL